MTMMKRQDVENRLNHPNRYKYTSRSSLEPSSKDNAIGVRFTYAEIAKLEVEYEGLDTAWKSNQENPMLNFVPASRDAISPLHLPSSQKSQFKSVQSPIAHLGKDESTGEGSSEVGPPSTLLVTHPERIPLFSICSRRCMKCERVLVKPSSEGGSLSALGGAEAFAALPDFKRRHSALSFTPMIDVKAANAFEDYKPSLDFDNWNSISLTLTNPPSMPALHITLSSAEKMTSNEVARDQDVEGSEKKIGTTDSTSQHEHARSTSICQVDCNGCDTWILEDEPINLEDSYGEAEDGGMKPAESPAWMSHPGVPTHLQLLESDSDNPAISSRKSSQVTMVVLVMPESKKFDALNKAMMEKSSLKKDEQAPSKVVMEVPIICEMELHVKWPSPTETNPENVSELRSPFRVNLSKLFEVHH